MGAGLGDDLAEAGGVAGEVADFDGNGPDPYLDQPNVYLLTTYRACILPYFAPCGLTGHGERSAPSMFAVNREQISRVGLAPPLEAKAVARACSSPVPHKTPLHVIPA